MIGLSRRKPLPTPTLLSLMLVAIPHLRLTPAIVGPSIIILAVLSIYHNAQLREALHYPSTHHNNIATDMQNLRPPPPIGHSNTTTTRPKFDCAINWVRVPKTASSSVELVFMRPLLESELFSTTYLIENSCLFGPGGCSTFWNTTRSQQIKFTVDADGDTPPYFGIGPRTDRRNIVNTTNNLGRCFPRFNTFCYEFDQKTNTMNFGPPSKMMWMMKKKFGLELNANKTSQQKEENFLKVLSKNGSHYITPTTSGHTGLDTSVFGWVLPPNPLVFSVFRDPLQRLLSSFHFGIRFGANRPGQVGLCSNKYGGPKWKEGVAEAIKIATASNNTNTTMYQTMLRGYLEECLDATHNVYTRFLDPLTQNLTVALNHLESHVIVGMQSNLEETLQRWIHITLGACSEHPKYSTLKHTLTKSFKIHGKKKRNENVIVKGLGRTSFPDTTKFDMDLQNLISACIEEDEIVYERAIELYEEQRRWVL